MAFNIGYNNFHLNTEVKQHWTLVVVGCETAGVLLVLLVLVRVSILIRGEGNVLNLPLVEVL